MKRMLAMTMISIMLAATAATTAAADDDVKISGAVEVQYLRSSDTLAAKGGDEVKPEEIYITIDKEVSETTALRIKLDGADMNKSTHSHKMVEEAYIEFKNILGQPLSLIYGKDEMPFGQDYEKFFISSRTHGFEIDKVWGFHAIYKVDGLGKVSAAVFERDTTKDVAMTESFAAEVKADKLSSDFSIEASYAKRGKEEGAAEEDETRYSVGAVYKVGALTLHAEHTGFSDYDFTKGRDLDVTLVGVDYKVGKALAMVRYEASDDSVAGNEDERIAYGLSYKLDKNTTAAVEYQTTSYDSASPEEDIFLLGAKVKF